jgi:hypothetical protein
MRTFVWLLLGATGALVIPTDVRTYAEPALQELTVSQPAQVAAVVQRPVVADAATAAPSPVPAPVQAIVPPVLASNNAATIAVVPPAVPSELDGIIAAAKQQFSPATPADVQKGKAEFVAAAQRLDAYLSAYGPNGEAWKTYLLWPQLSAQMQPTATFDQASLEPVLQRFSAAYVGLDWPLFADVRRTLQAYSNHASSVGDSAARATFEARLDKIAKAMQAGSADDFKAAADTAWELEQAGQAPDVVAALRRRFAQPNILVQASAALVTSGIGRPVDDVSPLRDSILGMNVSGTGHTIGQVYARLLPDPNRAMIQTVLQATAYTQTVGCKGPAVVYASGATNLCAYKNLLFDANGLFALPAASSAKTNARVTGIATTKRGLVDRIVKRVAWKQVPQTKAASERISAEHATWRVNARMDEESQPLLAKANESFMTKLRQPLMNRGEFPELNFSTTTDHLFLHGLQANHGRFAAPTSPPALEGSHELSLQIHESMVNNTAAGLFAGRTLTHDEAERISANFGAHPTGLENDEERGPWSITFAQPAPITVRFNQGTASVTVRGQKFTTGPKQFDPMNITAHYRFVHSDGRVRAVRQGDLEIVPPGFVQGRGRMALRHTVLKSMLERRFNKILQPELVSHVFELPGAWQKAGPLETKQFKADHGWLVVGWNKAVASHTLGSKPEAPAAGDASLRR